MLNHRGRLMGDLTVTRLGEDRFWSLGRTTCRNGTSVGSAEHLPEDGVQLTNVSDQWMGFSLSGRHLARDPAEARRHREPCGTCRSCCSPTRLMDVGTTEAALVGRISLTGELGFEITVPATSSDALLRCVARGRRSARHAAHR